MYDYGLIKKQIDKYPYISFDMFDTLIKRNIKNPTDLFSIIEEKYGVRNFKNERIQAEKRARKVALHEEPSLSDIYLYLDERIKSIEIKLEMDLCQQNKAFYPLYEYAVKQASCIIQI